MLRAASIVAALCLVAAPAWAEPAAAKEEPGSRARDAEPAEKKAEPAKKKAAPAADEAKEEPEQPAPAGRPAAAAPARPRAPGPDLSRAAAEAARKAPAPAARPPARPGLDLAPTRVLEQVARGDRRGAERSPGLSLGDDGDWKVHAAQVGVMAAGFAALTALCSGGACMIPDAATDWIPGLGDDPAPAPVQVRDPGPLRSPH